MMFPKRLLAFMLLFVLALMGAGEARAQWVQTNGPPWGGDKVLCLRDNNGTLLAGLVSTGVYVSTDGGNSWTNPQTYPRDNSVYAIKGLGLYEVLGIEYGVMIARNPVSTWSYANTGFDDSRFYAVTSFFSGNLTVLAGTENDGIYSATLMGSDSIIGWTAVNKGLPGSISTATVTCFGYDDNGNVVAGINPCGLFISTNNGQSWSSYGLPNSPINSYVNIGYTHVAGTSEGIYTSTDNGNHWNQVNSSNVSSLSLDGTYGNLYAGTNTGVYISHDSGITWKQANEGLADTIITSLYVANGDLFAGTGSHGVWRRPLSDFGISSITQASIPASSEIQVYPNPSSGSTTVSFTSPASAYAEVFIVNTLGVKVARLYSGELAAGEHSFMWSKPPGLPDGMYECLVRVNGEAKTLPMVVRN